MQQCTFYLSMAILISSVGFPRDCAGGLTHPRYPTMLWLTLVRKLNPKNPALQRISAPQDLMPILYVARIMVGTFSTDVWHVNNMNLLLAPLHVLSNWMQKVPIAGHGGEPLRVPRSD